MKGIVIKNQNGYFSVLNENQSIHRCRSRGALKKKSELLVGDTVEYVPVESDQGVIDFVYPRKTVLHRPPVANIDRIVFVSSIQMPDLDLFLLDKMIVLAENAGIFPIILISKKDLNPIYAEKAAAMYRKIGYNAISVCMQNLSCLGDIQKWLCGHMSAFSGPSGTGKSTLLNLLLGKSYFISQNVSRQTGRGKNTTRHAELIRLDASTFLMDTPGYTLLDCTIMGSDEIAFSFIEFRKYLGQCRFNDCHHAEEPDCAIKHAVERGDIFSSRYASYRKIWKDHQEKQGGRSL